MERVNKKSYQYDVRLSDDKMYIINDINVPLTLEVFMDVIEKTNKIHSQTGIDLVFSDVRNSRNVISMTENYNLFSDPIKRTNLMSKASRVAILADEGDHSHYPPETFANNAGYSIKVFFDETSALEWLLA